jgi:inorganic triphosphatase YgiF
MAIEGLERIHDRRTRRIVREGVGADGGRVELALDRATYVVGGESLTIAEVEVEAHGEGGPVERVARALLAEHAGRLRPWRHSKLAVGLALERLGRRGELVAWADDGPGEAVLDAIDREAARVGSGAV